MKKFLRITLLSLLGLLGGLVITVALVWQWPNLVFRKSNLMPLVRWFAPEVSGEVERFDIRSHGLFKKELQLALKNPCYEMAPDQKACFASLILDGEVRLRGNPTKINVRKLTATQGNVNWTVKPSKEEPKKKDAPGDELIPEPPALLSTIEMGEIDIALDRLSLKLESGVIDGKARLTAHGAAAPLFWKLETQGTFADKKDRYDWNGNVEAKTQKSIWQGPFQLTSDLKTTFPQKGRGTVKLSGDLEPKRVRTTIKVDGAMGKRKAALEAKLDITASDFKAVLNGNADRIHDSIARVVFAGCVVEYHKKSKRTARAEGNCPFVVNGAFCRFQGAFCKEMSRDIAATIVTGLDLQTERDGEQSVSGDASLQVDSLFSRMKEGKASLAINLLGKVSEFPQNFVFNSKAGVEVQSFKKIVELLRDSPWSIPAPFNDLDGSITLSAEGKGNLLQEGGEIPLKLQTDLASSNQALRIGSNGNISLKKSEQGGLSGNLDLDVTLNDVKIALPPLTPSAPPRALPDGRLQSGTRAPAKASAFTYHVKIATGASPIQILSNLAKAPIPLTIDMKIDSAVAPAGAIRISSFPVEVFHRKATIEHLYLFMKKDPRYNEIDGKIRVVYTDYTVYIVLLGLAERPEIRFESVPPLPESDVLAVLLFGKKPERLSADEASSVGNTRAAVQDNALGLASMYLLASTPVESIGYDPLSKSFRAKIRLADGTSVTVGSDLKEINQLGIRQRLGNNWAITTYLTDPFSVVNRSLTALLEWSVGY